MMIRKENVRMEDINGWVGELIDKIESEVEDLYYDRYNNYSLEEQENLLFDGVREVLEKFFHYPDYRNYN